MEIAQAQSRRQVRPRSSRLFHSASFRATKPNKASMAQMLAAAEDPRDAHARRDGPYSAQRRNDAEWHRRELLGRTWRRDWAMPDFQIFSDIL